MATPLPESCAAPACVVPESLPDAASEPPRVLHRVGDDDDRNWTWLPRTASDAPQGASLVTVVYVPTAVALRWALPWGSLPGPLSVEETAKEQELQVVKHAEAEKSIDANIRGYAYHVLGEMCADSEYLVMEELPDLVSSKVWDGAKLLRQVLLERGGWTAVRVLELGAGVGLTGLALAAAGADVVVTDMDRAMPVLRENAHRNADLVARRGGRIQPAALDWHWDAERQHASLPWPRADLVVGADIIYEADCVRPLLRTAFSLADEFLVLQNIRRGSTDMFLAVAGEMGLEVQRDPLEMDFYEFWRLTRS